MQVHSIQAANSGGPSGLHGMESSGLAKVAPSFATWVHLVLSMGVCNEPVMLIHTHSVYHLALSLGDPHTFTATDH